LFLQLLFMKTPISLIILGLLISTGCYAQNKFPEGISKVKNEQFQVEYTGIENELILVYNVKSRYTKGGSLSDNPLVLPFSQDDIHFDITAANAIIQKVLKPKNEKLHQNEDFVHVIFKFEQSGKLTDISYGFKKGTLISLEDIAEIDARLRKNITASFTGKAYKDYKFLIYYLRQIRF